MYMSIVCLGIVYSVYIAQKIREMHMNKNIWGNSLQIWQQ